VPFHIHRLYQFDYDFRVCDLKLEGVEEVENHRSSEWASDHNRQSGVEGSDIEWREETSTHQHAEQSQLNTLPDYPGVDLTDLVFVLIDLCLTGSVITSLSQVVLFGAHR